jgi:hypothetical protein
LAALLVGALAAGCSLPDAAASTKPARQDVFPPDVVLDGTQQRQLLDAMRAAGAGVPVRPLVAAQNGVRWSDVETAVRNVADVQFLGVYGVASKPDVLTAGLQTEDGQPGTVTVRLQADGRIVAHADIGIFSNFTKEQEFEAAFDTEMRRLGAIPRPR